MASGTLDGVSFTITGLANPSLITANLSGGNYSADPGSATQQTLHYSELSNFTVLFASPISTLYLYDVNWRPEDLADYDFSQSISILSGNSTATVSGGTDFDATNYDSFLNGIIELDNVTSFTVTQNFSDPSAQILDFAGTASPLSAPEPSSLALLTFCVAALLIRRHSRASLKQIPRA